MTFSLTLTYQRVLPEVQWGVVTPPIPVLDPAYSCTSLQRRLLLHAQLTLKAHDTTAQSALAIGGAVYFEHLTAAAQSVLTTVATADADAVSQVSGAQTAAAAARYSLQARLPLSPNGSLPTLVAVQMRTNDLGRLVSVTTAVESTLPARRWL